MKRLLLPSLALVSLIAAGCSHPLRITNLEDFYTPPSMMLKEPVVLGVSSNSSLSPEQSRYVAAIVDALQKNSSVGRIIYPYNRAANADRVDAAVDIAVHPKYSGDGSNFWVNFPGFLIFAPAIWGYGYNAQIETVVTIDSPTNGSQRLQIPTRYRFRQAEIDRTWTEVGWLEVGIIPLIGGFAFMQYDPDVTTDFIIQAGPSYGAFVANRILSAEALSGRTHRVGLDAK